MKRETADIASFNKSSKKKPAEAQESDRQTPRPQ